ncbi:MAG TPA: HEAT repeat domain-containing protein [Gemmataceae bacterium]|nr:HEAT repeat domain-containing protein [Gemmataceae bacterium]
MKRFLTLALGTLLFGWFGGVAPAQNTAADLAKLLNKSQQSVEVRRAAAFALKYNLQSADVIDALIDAFKDSDEVVRANASDAIALLTPKTAVPPLTLALKSPDPNVRTQAARTLGRIKRYTDEAIPNLVFLLKDENFDARQAAAEALKRIHNSTREY